MILPFSFERTKNMLDFDNILFLFIYFDKGVSYGFFDVPLQKKYVVWYDEKKRITATSISYTVQYRFMQQKSEQEDMI